MLLATSMLLITNPGATVNCMLDASASALDLCISLCGIYAVWLGLLEILDASGLMDKLASVLKPIIKRLFPDANLNAQKYISINISANMLGLGNAATPYGIKAMQEMDTGHEKANNSMLMLMIINACSIQILPTTTIGLRATAGSTSPADIILPTLIVTFLACFVGIGLGLICGKLRNKMEKRRKT